ncbi:YiiG family protein [Tardiphaga sp. 866_E4_N2_1]|uniref:YiiG family protein n=1 Tax=unclassified Tardiphaga TaxID=2631404 RepID=UPI003F226399
MISFRAFAIAAATLVMTPAGTERASAQISPATEKLNAYVGCINRLSARAYDSQSRYFSWAPKSGPTGKERIIYGTYTIYDTADCAKNVAAANTLEPRDSALEAAAFAYVSAVTALGPLLKEADDYYTQENYKDDKMAKGRALHPRLITAWDAFADADKKLRANVEAINDRRKAEELVAIEAKEGKKTRYYVEAIMIDAKRVVRLQDTDKPDIEAITKAVSDYEANVKALEEVSTTGGEKIGSMFASNAKSVLVTAKQLMRRIRDKVPYTSGQKMMMSPGSAWMVEGSPARLLRDYNQLIEAYNRGTRI